MEHLYWIGVRKSDLLSVDELYKGCITFFGDGKNRNIALFNTGRARKNHNINIPIFDEFNRESILEILNNDPEAKFMFYNPVYAYLLEEELRKKVICLNDIEILNILDNKILCKLWLKNEVQLFESKQFLGMEIDLKKLDSIFGNSQNYLIQSSVSSGGTGTYILNPQNQKILKDKLCPHNLYTVTPYYRDATSFNIHCVIYSNSFQLYPISVQILKEEHGNLLYKGCDFIAANVLDSKLKTELEMQAANICQKLCNINYRGVCGIDFILIDGKIYFCEINPRFQASTLVLNYALKQNNLISINEANLFAFKDRYQVSETLIKIDIPYSLYVYEKNAEYEDFHKNIFNIYFQKHPEFKILKDGYCSDSIADEGTYLFRSIFPHSLVDISNGKTHITELLSGYSLKNPVNPVLLKIMLINFGVNILPEADKFIKNKGKLREGNFSAIDILLGNDLVINCPYKINHTEYSPFYINFHDQHLVLYYFDHEITEVDIYFESNLNQKKTLSGIPYRSVAFLATDRLRINYNPVCYYKQTNKACQFCNLPVANCSYNFSDITEITEDFLKNENFRHILLGGGSSQPRGNFSEILKLASYLRSKTDMPIYLMSIPPYNLEIIEQFYKVGITEVAFNIEIFDNAIAQKYMPGKGLIPRNHYFDALKKAVSLWGKSGNVRSMVIAGLEPDESLLSGIEKLCQIGVQPMVSIFRPMDGTPLQDRVPLPSVHLFELYAKIKALCFKYEQTLGPTCIYCQNNTLSLPQKYENMAIYIK